MQYREFVSLLHQKGAGRLYLLTGEEPYYLERAWRELAAVLFPDGNQDEALTELEDTAPLGRLIEAIETVPFFSPSNVVLIKGSRLFKEKKKKDEDKDNKAAGRGKTQEEKQLELLLGLLENIPETSVVVFLAPGKADGRRKIYKTIERHGVVLVSEPVKPWELADWLTVRLRERQLRLEKRAERCFVEAASLMNPVSLGFLDRELEKLELFSQGRTVTEAEVREAFSNVPEVSGFAMLDAIDARAAQRALSLLERQLAEGTALPLLTGILVTHVRRLRLAQLLQEKGIRGRQLGTHLEMNAYIAERVGRTAATYSPGLLRQIYLKLAEADYAVKTGGGGAELLEQAVIALVRRS